MLVLYVSDTAAVCVLSARRHPAHPVSVPILPPREIQVTWLYVLLVRVLLAIFLIYLVSWSTETVFFFFPSHFLSSSPFFSLPPSYTAVTQIRIRGHIAEVLLPPPYYGSCLAFLWREGFSHFFPRRSRRIAPINIIGAQKMILAHHFLVFFFSIPCILSSPFYSIISPS